MSAAARVAYHFALLRVVPHVHLGSFVNVGVVLHARTAEFLGMHAITADEALETLLRDVDVPRLRRYLECYDAICAGDERAGPIALLSPSERFHWITSPRSDVLQASPVHEGLCLDPGAELADLFSRLVHPVAR